MNAVSDAGPIIHLSWIGQLDLLGRIFTEVLIPEEVRDELLHRSRIVPGIESIHAALGAGWLKTRSIHDRGAIMNLASLDPGEAEALVLMREVDADLMLVDDRRARNEAEQQGLRFTGTTGVLQMAREQGFVPAVTPLLLVLREHGFWISESLVDRVRHEEAR